MLTGIAGGAIDDWLLPSENAAHEIGDYAANCARLREMLTG